MFESLFENIGKGSVDEAHEAVIDVLKRLEPLLRDLELRAGGILHGLLDRFEINITIKLNPIPKAERVGPSE
jgi:hypothetical protein